jgi:uncharacterized protein (DUF342 family)
MASHISERELTELINQLELDSGKKKLLLNYKQDNLYEYEIAKDGSIRIIDNQIFVQAPSGTGDYPMIQAKDPVVLRVNGKEVHTKVTVTESDLIEWSIRETPMFEITVSEDKLQAFFHLRSKERYEWRLTNQQASSDITVSAFEDTTRLIDTILLHDVIALFRKKLIKNPDIPAIQQELDVSTYQPVLIAKGKPVVPAEDARLELYFTEQVESVFSDVAGVVDYRNHLNIPSVQRGDVLAKKTPAVQGIPGCDVYGRTLIPNSPKDIIIVTKSSVELNSEGEIVALREGRPRITGNKIKTFDISTSYIVPGDVDIETGHIFFSGDVVVYGDVTDNMIIESLGNVYVFGSVFNCTITATGSIYIKGNMIGCKVYSGYFGVMFNRLYSNAKMLREQINNLLSASKLLMNILESKNQVVHYGQIIVLLMETKFKQIPSIVKEMLFVIANVQQIKKQDFHELKHMLESFLQPSTLHEVATVSALENFHALLQETHQEVARMQEVKVQVNIMQCQNSELKSNGDIVVLREGVLLSDLFSSGNIVFRNDASVCRGAKLEAGGSIDIKTVGGQTGVATVLKAKRQVKVKKMYAGRVCIDRYCKDIFEVVENMTYDNKSVKQ